MAIERFDVPEALAETRMLGAVAAFVTVGEAVAGALFENRGTRLPRMAIPDKNSVPNSAINGQAFFPARRAKIDSPNSVPTWRIENHGLRFLGQIVRHRPVVEAENDLLAIDDCGRPIALHNSPPPRKCTSITRNSTMVIARACFIRHNLLT